MRPSEILDAQADLLDRLKDKDLFYQQIALAAAAAMQQYHLPNGSRDNQALVGRLSDELTDTSRAAGQEFTDHLARQVENAYAYRVTHDMELLVEHVADQLDDSDQWDFRMPPTPAGFIRFDRPIEVREMRGDNMLVHFAIWGPASIDLRGTATPATVYQFFNDIWTQPDESWERYGFDDGGGDDLTQEEKDRYLRAIGRWASTSIMIMFHGEAVGPPTVREKSEEEYHADGIYGSEATTNLGRHMFALFFLLNQTISTVKDEYPDRAGGRRAKRRNFPPKVSVITLRRSEGNRQEGESLVEWHHRWIVRGHMRWQPYGVRKVDHVHDLGQPELNEHGHATRHCQHEGCDHFVSRIYIAPYEKGPEGAPLVVSTKLYDLSR